MVGEALVETSGLPSGADDVALIGDDGLIYRTADFQSNPPTWIQLDPGMTDVQYYSWVVDPFSPAYRGTGATINGWVVGRDNIWRLTDIFGTPAASSVHTFAFSDVDITHGSGKIHFSRTISASLGDYQPVETDNPWLMVVSYYEDAVGHVGTWATYSVDGGQTWSSEVLISASYDSGLYGGSLTRQRPIGLYLSPKTPGLAYTAAYATTGNPPTADAYVSADWGATWAAMSDPDIQPGHGLASSLHVPWPVNDAEDVIFHDHMNLGVEIQHRLKRVTAAAIVDVSPIDAGIAYGVAKRSFGVRTYDGDRSFVALGGVGNDTTASHDDDFHAVFVSDDNGATWTMILPPLNDGFFYGYRGYEVAFSGDDPLALFIWGATPGDPGCISFTSDFGTTVLDKTGNLFDDFYDLLGVPTGILGLCTATVTISLAAPINLSATPVSSSQIDLTWVDESGAEVGYPIEQSNDGLIGWAVIHTTAANVTSYSVTGLPASTTLYYRVRAYLGSNFSDYSSVANATTLAAPAGGDMPVALYDITGCPTFIPNGLIGQVLAITPSGQPGYISDASGPSADAGNALRTGSDGRSYVSCEEIQDCIGVAIAAGTGLTYEDALDAISNSFGIPITSAAGVPPGTAGLPTIYTNTSTGNIYYRDSTGAIVLLTLGQTPITVVDTPTVDLTVSGTNNHTVTAAVKVSATAGNQVVANADGLFVAATGAQTPLTVNDSTTIDLTASGTSNHTLTAAVINDPAGGLKINAGGEAIKIDPASTAGVATLSSAGLKITVPTAAAANGLSIVSSVTELGGPLTKNTTIAQAGFTLSLTNAGPTNTGINMSNVGGSGFVRVEPSGNANLGTSGTTRVQLLTNNLTRMEILSTGIVLIEGPNTANTSGLRFTNLNSASPATGGAAHLGVDGAGNVVVTSGSTSLTVNDSATIDLTATGTDNHTLTAAVKLSATAGNQVVANVDGIFVPSSGGQTPITANDSTTVDLTASGTNSHTLVAALINDPAGGLQANAGGEGIKIDPASTSGVLTLSSAGLKATFAQTALTVNDSTTIDLTASGTNNHTLTAAVINDPAAGLQANAGGEGIKIDPASTSGVLTLSSAGLKATFTQTSLTVNDSTSIDLTASGTNNHTLTAVVINDPAGGLTIGASGEKVLLDPAAGNLLTLSASGLKATETAFTATDSTTIDFTTSGTSTHTLTGSVINDTAGGLTSGASGEKVLVDPVAGNLLAVSSAGTKALATTSSGVQGTGAAAAPIKENLDNLPAAPATLIAGTTFVVAADGTNNDGSQATSAKVATLILGQPAAAVACALPTTLLGYDGSGVATKYLLATVEPTPTITTVTPTGFYAAGGSVPAAGTTTGVVTGTISVTNTTCRTRLVRFSMEAWAFFNLNAPDNGSYLVYVQLNGGGYVLDHSMTHLINYTVAPVGVIPTGYSSRSTVERYISAAAGVTETLDIRVDFVRVATSVTAGGYTDTGYTNVTMNAAMVG